MLGPATSNYTLKDVCIGVGGGTKAWDFGAGPTTICSSGGTACTSPVTSSGLVLPSTAFKVSTNQPLMIAVDMNSAANNRPYTIPSVGSSAFSPTPQNAANYNTYIKTGVQEACTQTKQTSYTSNLGLSSNIVALLKSVVTQ